MTLVQILDHGPHYPTNLADDKLREMAARAMAHYRVTPVGEPTFDDVPDGELPTVSPLAKTHGLRTRRLTVEVA